MIAIIDITGNNLTSLSNAIARLGYSYQLTHDSDQIQNARSVILPGVGTALSGMNALNNYGLVDLIRSLKQPVLGICLGMQLLLKHSEEENVDCLGLIPGTATKLSPNKQNPVPHMGWNKLLWTKKSVLASDLSPEEYVYFVHSYAMKNSEYAVARCQYTEEFTAIVNKDNFFGMQFHPEKSAETGLTLLKNFLEMEYVC
ncbi:imidazole glycerol phosphate synthase subunit HisH [Legionella waltersii]|uniref:Imidazole glycerol phosphate synthase subunit HisH n=1 Tax=Legionella waltersii TaxID=66969 RepID=A0A0W1AMY9_9GAMM|nr:imidazole glycerol phosphate synthase subunit HisH [Legionella waltersii]KTD82687.1 imidazole glycerol phosphate synthase subunit HisH [Legionella waltersii]SNV03310.1 glutamine amidotransferase [Legionella waltersii]